MDTEHVHVDKRTPDSHHALVAVAVVTAVNAFNRVSILSRHPVRP